MTKEQALKLVTDKLNEKGFRKLFAHIIVEQYMEDTKENRDKFEQVFNKNE